MSHLIPQVSALLQVTHFTNSSQSPPHPQGLISKSLLTVVKRLRLPILNIQLLHRLTPQRLTRLTPTASEREQ